MKVAHLIVHGYVQGVGYRKFVRHIASKLGLTGWVRNVPDGTVEAEVGGLEDRVKDLITACKKGPTLSEVSDIEVQWQEKEFPFEGFIIRHE